MVLPMHCVVVAMHHDAWELTATEPRHTMHPSMGWPMGWPLWTTLGPDRLDGAHYCHIATSKTCLGNTWCNINIGHLPR